MPLSDVYRSNGASEEVPLAFSGLLAESRAFIVP